MRYEGSVMQNTAFKGISRHAPATKSPAPYLGLYVDILILSITIGTILAVMMLSNLPNLDIPDIKDNPFLFPNYNPA
jgi:hypothetical protein